MSEGPRLFGPDGKEVRKDQPILVDAFGRSVHAPSEEKTPERPRLRALELIAAQDRDREVLIARDPMGVSENPVVLRLEMLPLLQLLDGNHSVEELSSRAMAETGEFLRIGELSKRVGVSPELLRAWERRYGLVRPTRSAAFACTHPPTPNAWP